MAEKWIKLATGLFEDEKIRLIEQMYPEDADTIINIWIRLLCLAGKQNNGGRITITGAPCSDETFSVIFSKKIEKISKSFEIFKKFSMIKRKKAEIVINNWEKHQQNTAYEKRLENDRKRQQQRRERISEREKMSRDTSRDVTLQIREDKIREDKIREDDEARAGAGAPPRIITNTSSSPPSRNEVADYIRVKGYRFTADRFLDYYKRRGYKFSAGGWKESADSWAANDIEDRSGAISFFGGSFDTDDFFDAAVKRAYKEG